MPRGGARPNSGGKRAGAGRKPKVLAPLPASDIQQSPLAFMLETMRDGKADPRVRLDAAKAAAPYLHAKLGGVGKGKKEARDEKGAAVAKGKFSAGFAPKLVSNGR